MDMALSGIISTVEDLISGNNSDTPETNFEGNNAAIPRKGSSSLTPPGSHPLEARHNENALYQERIPEKGAKNFNLNKGKDADAENRISNRKSNSFQGSVPQFEARTKNIQLLHRLISSVESFGNYCLLDISSEGMCFSISDGHVCKIRLNLNKKVFSVFTFNGVWRKSEYTETQLYGEDTDLSEDESNPNYVMNGFDPDLIITLNLNISSLLETMNIHVKDKKNLDEGLECVLRYERDGDPFVMIFEDDSIVERCELNTFYNEDVVGLKRSQKRKKGKKSGKKLNGKEASNLENNIDPSSDLFGVGEDVIDDSVFRIDNNKILFDIIMKSNILHDTIKDMSDLLTDRFILYLKKMKENPAISGRNINSDLTNGKSDLIFISKSKSDTIGFSKLIVPQNRSHIPEFKLSMPVTGLSDETNEDHVQTQDCYGLSLSSTYHFSNFSRLLKAIKLSKMIKIRKDMNGITSLVLLLGKNESVNQQQAESNGMYGSSIEFVTLESVPVEELSSLHQNYKETTLLSKLGYANHFVEQLIKDDREVQTIRVGNDGQLFTLDDFFGDARAEFDRLGDIQNIGAGHFDQPIPIEPFAATNTIVTNEHSPKETQEKNHQNVGNNKNILKLTEQLTMSLLGHPVPVRENSNNSIQVEKTVIEHEEADDNRMKKRGSNSANKRGKNSAGVKRVKKHKERKENEGIETVGGAIEIPLFI